MMTLSSRIATIVTASLLLVGSAYAQPATPPAAAPPPAATPSTPAPSAAAAATKPRSAASLDCSKQADAQGLHGKKRKTFRSECKAAAKPK
jgi:hypothetical protein